MVLRSKEEAKQLKLNTRFIRKVLQPPKPTNIFRILSKSTPRRETSRSDSSVRIGNQLFDTITTHRVFRDEDIEGVFRQAIEENPEVKESVMQEAIRLVRKELDI